MTRSKRSSTLRVAMVVLLGIGVAFQPTGVAIDASQRVQRTADTIVPVGSTLPRVEWTRSERRLMRRINAARAARGIHKLRWTRTVGHVARKHSRLMRAEGDIWHSDLGSMLNRFSWSIAGENVGMGPSVWSVHRAFMKSDGHRKNNLRRSFHRMGVGIVWANGTAYMTVMFLG